MSLEDKVVLAEWCEMAEVAEETATEDRALRSGQRRPGTRIGGSHAENTNFIHLSDRALSTVALIVGTLALGAVWMQSNKDPQILDAKLRASAAEVRASLQQEVADTRAIAQAGKEHARIALDEVQRANAKLEAKGLIPPANH